MLNELTGKDLTRVGSEIIRVGHVTVRTGHGTIKVGKSFCFLHIFYLILKYKYISKINLKLMRVFQGIIYLL